MSARIMCVYCVQMNWQILEIIISGYCSRQREQNAPLHVHTVTRLLLLLLRSSSAGLSQSSVVLD
jgi:hypothetical protein